MAEQAGSGPVEQEARQLVEAAARWLAAVPDSGAYADRAADRETASEAEAGFGEAEFGVEDAEAEFGAEETGARDPGAEHLCRGCPWCRAKAAAGPLGADTLDSIAHLLSAAAESLSLFAQSRRDAAGAHDEPSRDERSAGHHEESDDSRHHQSDDSEGTARWA